MNSDDADSITHAFLSDSSYEQLRYERFSHFNQPVTTKLTVQAALLAGLALVLPIYAVYPSTMAEYLPAVDPMVASPKVLLLGVIGGTVQLATSGLLVVTALYRLRCEPLTEYQAHRVLNVEDLASYLGLGTGALAIVVTLGYFLLGLAGTDAVAGYLSVMDGTNPFAASGVDVSVTQVGVLAASASIVVYVVKTYLQWRLPRLAP